MSELMIEDKETSREKFVYMVKKAGKIYASPSHEQSHPDHISSSAILEWQWDGELFSITATGRRVVCSEDMPAFHIYK